MAQSVGAGLCGGELRRGRGHPLGASCAVDHVVPEPGSSLTEAYEKWREWADGKSCCDYALHVDVTHWSDSVKQEVQGLIKDKGEPQGASSRPLPVPAPLSHFCLLSAWGIGHECWV